MALTKRAKTARLLLGDWRGQATVELAAVFPVVLIMAVIVINIVNYLGICASFDRAFPQQVRVFTASPSYGFNQGDVVAAVQTALLDHYGREYSSLVVTVSEDAYGNSKFSGSFEYEPTLFGLNFRSILFGIELPSLRHETSFALNCYRSGVIV